MMDPMKLKAKQRILDEIENLIGDSLGSKLKKPDSMMIAMKSEDEGSPEEEKLESPEMEAKEEGPTEDDRLMEAMRGKPMSGMESDDEESHEMPGDEEGDDSALIKALLMKKKSKGF